MARNASRALRISLAAAAVLLLFAETGFAARTYAVRGGDTLYSIAGKYGVSVAALKSANHLSSTALKTGRTLTVPSKQVTPPADPVVYGISTENDLLVESAEGVVASLAKDARFTVLAREGDRFNVKLETGRTGWVRADAVTLEDTRKPLPLSDTWGIKHGLVQTALAYRGARYVRGGTSARGFDCSGFVKFLYARMGIKLPHDTRALYKFGRPVAKADLAPGDILFFVNTYRRGLSHVGLYVGEGKFIHASTHRTGVRVDYLNADYYRRHYIGAKRI
ncbi:MAG: NlpC/P60 family protein [Armatimonadetes bacterium]|nr:NlpC/P60 family protein [Armatimonadota bacterium]